MPVTQQEIDSFHEFASAALISDASGQTIAELFDLWSSDQINEDDLKAIKASLRDLEVGERGKPLEQFRREFAEQHGLHNPS